MKTVKVGVLGDVVKNVMSGIKKKGRLTQEEIESFWKRAVGRKAASHTKPVSIRRARLVVNVDRSPWLYEMTVKKKKILKKLADGLKENKIKDIRFRIGEIK